MTRRLDDPPREWRYGLTADRKWLTVDGDFQFLPGDDRRVRQWTSMAEARSYREAHYPITVWAEAIGIFEGHRRIET